MNYPFQITREITQEALIPPYNHIHHADLIRQLEDARVELLDAIGQPLQSFLDRGLFWVIAAIQIEYLREVKEGESVVTCEAPTMTERRLIIPQRIYNHRKKLAVRAQVELALFSVEQQRGITIPSPIVAAFKAEDLES